MLVLATFLAICTVATIFLLRFLFALHADSRAHGERLAGHLKYSASRRIGAQAKARSSLASLKLVHSSTGLALRPEAGAKRSHFQANTDSRFEA
jgi:hypothetical protein